MTTKNPRIKICGITRLEDANLASDLGAWALGFIFYDGSPRFIEPSKAALIISPLKQEPLRFVGVFVNPSLEQLSEAVKKSGVNTIQLHGNESPEFCAMVKKKFPRIELIKAIRMDEAQGNSAADYQLIDSVTDREWGGTGKVVDWKKAAQITGKQVILAGGITAQNILQALEAVSPFAIDLSSGVESAPGIKSEQKLRELFRVAKTRTL